VNIWTSGDWGTREQAIPGEWAALVLIMVIGAAAGFLVLWFTMLRHERTVLHRARRRTALRPSLALDGSDLAEVSELVDVAGTAPLEDVLGVGGEAEDAASTDDDGEDSADATDDDDEGDGNHGVDAGADPGPAREPLREDDAGTDAEPDEDEDDAREPEPAPMCAAGRATARPPGRKPAKGQRRKLADEILHRVEHEIAGRTTWRCQDLATLVHREFGVSVH
jgi:hypothetical protein